MSDARSRDALVRELAAAQAELEAAATKAQEARAAEQAAVRRVAGIRRKLGKFVWSAEETRGRADRKVWRTGNGTEVAYSDMDRPHLTAAVETARAFDPGHPALEGLREELARRDREGR